jgi:phosphatidylserine/phosphatidylglycerophosphate/cardiolipin synthase-like enzyme
MTSLLKRADELIGGSVERAVLQHHRRRLRRIGWEHALDAPAGEWASGPPEPRPGNAVEFLVDGADALPAIAEAIASAKRSVHLAGWFFSPDFHLGPDGPTLREVLADAAERVDVRVLAWAGSPLPLFHPDRKEAREALERLTNGTRIRYRLDAHERPMHCHHEKLVILDDRIAFVSGIDLTSLGGDRLDESLHPPREDIGWHDASAKLAGPAVADVAAHFAFRWREVTGETLPAAVPPPEAGNTTVQIVRTVPEKIYDALPRGDFSLLEAHLAALRSAERFVYIESQFLWSPEVVAVLADKLARPPCDAFRVLVVLPARPKNGQEDTRGQLAVLLDADGERGRFLACTIYQAGTHPPRLVYVHAKILIVDDRWLTLGSANLNEHSLFNDTEMNIVVADEEVARSLRLRLWAEHLDSDDVDGDVHTLIDERWRPLAEGQLQRIRDGHPPQHRLVRLPHVAGRIKRLLGPINGLLVDG